jgi:hypothetical protein
MRHADLKKIATNVMLLEVKPSLDIQISYIKKKRTNKKLFNNLLIATWQMEELVKLKKE